ncbi:MAG: hypothetical protein E3J87_07490 [Candidatus Cloacimonadota bacterium]|nr:MAG: hypothetical protein E3J87_07490 [Candidatus Cloacimonadota bacterium]
MNKKSRFYLPFFLTLILFLSMVNLSGDGWRNMTWVPGAPYNTERYAAGCAVQYEQAGTTATYIYVFGGNYDGYLGMSLSNRVFRYDPWADLQGQACWTQMANMPYSAYDFGVESGVRDGIVRLYLFAGYGPGYRNQIYEYTPITNTFLYRRTMSTREGTTQIGSVGGKLYAIGGDNGSTFLTINQEYNPATNGLLNRMQEPADRGDQAVVSVGDSVIFCIGGAYGSLSWADYANSNYMYKPSSNSWSIKANRGYLASGAVGGYFNDIIYNFSGGNSATYLRTVGRYRVSTNSWLSDGPLMPAVQDGAVCGVVTHFYKPTPFDLLTPTNGATVGSLKPTLTWESSDRTKGPRIWVITGGINASTTTARNSAYTITSDTTSANDTLLYTLYYSLEAIVDATVDSIVDLTTNSYTFTSDLLADTVYYWKVRRTDYYEETERWSNQLDWWFRTPPAVAIELSSFSAWLYRGGIKVIWRTESEKDNLRWLIERAYEKADNYTLIGTVDGQGNKPTPTDYAFTDKGVSKEGRYFYRLGAINSQGETEWNGPVSVIYRVSEAGSSILSVLPSGRGNVKINYIIGESSNTRIELFDLTGRRIATLLDGRKEKGKFSLTWNGRMSNGSSAPRGVYFCRMQSGSLSKVVKFVYMK